jgi:hypothetical protein
VRGQLKVSRGIKVQAQGAGYHLKKARVYAWTTSAKCRSAGSMMFRGRWCSSGVSRRTMATAQRRGAGSTKYRFDTEIIFKNQGSKRDIGTDLPAMIQRKQAGARQRATRPGAGPAPRGRLRCSRRGKMAAPCLDWVFGVCKGRSKNSSRIFVFCRGLPAGCRVVAQMMMSWLKCCDPFPP